MTTVATAARTDFYTEAVATRRQFMRRPGLIETTLVSVTFFIMLYQAPTAWFTDGSLVTDDGAPVSTALTLGLTFFAFLRVAGSIDFMLLVSRLSTPLTAFVLFSASSVFWSVNSAITSRRAALLLAGFGWACYLLIRFELPTILKLLSRATIPGVLINYLFVLGLPQYGISAAGWVGVFSQKNALGYTAAITMPLLIIVAGSDRGHRVLYYGVFLADLGLLLGSKSKTMLLAATIPILLLAVFHGFRGRKTLRGAVILSLLASTIFTLLFVTANLEFIAGLLDKDVTLTGRTDLWEALIPVALERPLFGFGADAAFGGYFSPIHEVWIVNGWQPSHAHNAILQTMMEVGLIGTVLFVTTYFKALGGAIEVVRRVPGRVGLWPLSFLTTTLMISISESGVMAAMPSYALFLICVWTVALQRDKPIRIDHKPASIDATD